MNLYFCLILITIVNVVKSCDVGYVYVKYRCVIAKKFNELCHIDQECRYHDVNSICEHSRCLCKNDFIFNSQLSKCTIRGIIFTNNIGLDQSYISWLNQSLIPVLGSKSNDNFFENETLFQSKCPFGYNWDEMNEKCEQKMPEKNLESLIFLLSLIIVFSIILAFIFGRKDQNFSQTEALNDGISCQYLLPIHTFETQSDETTLKETDFSHSETQLPSYQEVFENDCVVTISDELPTYEYAINHPKLI